MNTPLFDRSEYQRSDNTQDSQSLEAASRPRLRTAKRDQVEMQMLALDQILEPDHPARAIWDFVEQLDLSRLLSSIQAVEGHVGRDATDPQILLSLWIYATTQGVGSARQLAELTTRHIAYIWICGGVSVCHKLLSDFRSHHIEVLDDLMTQIVGTLMHEGLVSLQCVAQDGMRVRASAGKSSFRRKDSLQQCLEEARRQVETLKELLEKSPQELTARQKGARRRAVREREERLEEALRQMEELTEKREKRKKGDGEKTRVSTTDPDARNMKFSHGGYCPGYNVQFSTDTTSGVIVGVDVTNAGNDFQQLLPMAEQLESRYGRSPKEVLADGGFASVDQIKDMQAEHKIDVYAPVKEEDKKRAKGIDPYAPCKGDSPEIAQWRQRMGTEAAKQKSKQRCQTAEWANAQCRNRNFWFFKVRGLRNVLGVGLLHAVTHNILQAIKLRAVGGTT